MTDRPLANGTRVRHANQQWVTRNATAEVHDSKGPWPDGTYEYLVRTGEDFSREPGPDNPQTRWAWWSSSATIPTTEEPDRMTEQKTRVWTDIQPADATEIDLATDLTITAPLNENGERCPWPWGPQQMVGAPLGQYHCDYCGAMVMAGIPHIDYARTYQDGAAR